MKKIIKLIAIITIATISMGCVVDLSLDSSGSYRMITCYNYTGYDIYMVKTGYSSYSYSATGYDILYSSTIYDGSYGYTDYNYYGSEYFHAYDFYNNWIDSAYVGYSTTSISFF